MIKKSLFILFLIIPSISFSQYQRPGSSVAQFLDIGVSARAEAMAGAVISVEEGAEGAYYNPAMLTSVKDFDAAFTYTRWFADINHEFFSIAKNIGRVGTFAFSMTALHTDEMIVRTPLQPDGTGETFSSGSYRAGISFASELTNHVSVGLTGNFIRLYLYRVFPCSFYLSEIFIVKLIKGFELWVMLKMSAEFKGVFSEPNHSVHYYVLIFIVKKNLVYVPLYFICFPCP